MDNIDMPQRTGQARGFETAETAAMEDCPAQICRRLHSSLRTRGVSRGGSPGSRFRRRQTRKAGPATVCHCMKHWEHAPNSLWNSGDVAGRAARAGAAEPSQRTWRAAGGAGAFARSLQVRNARATGQQNPHSGARCGWLCGAALQLQAVSARRARRTAILARWPGARPAKGAHPSHSRRARLWTTARHFTTPLLPLLSPLSHRRPPRLAPRCCPARCCRRLPAAARARLARPRSNSSRSGSIVASILRHSSHLRLHVAKAPDDTVMTTAVAAPPVTAPHGPPLDGVGSSRTYATIAPSTSSPHQVTPNSKSSKPVSDNASPTSSESGSHQHRAEGKRSPLSARGLHGPKIVVKKEPSSPEIPTSRHRPRRLDLSSNHMVHPSGALTSRPPAPLTGKDSASIHGVGLACLSPGFLTHDPAMREQLQKSEDVRKRQMQIIEARQRTGKGPDDEGSRHDMSPFGRNIKTPNTSRRKGPPPGLSIAPPSHQAFANERVIQSAPINQSFTGLRNNLPPSRHVANGPSNLSQTSHIHHVPATQTNNRLPPISDVFPEPLGAPRSHYNNSPGNSSHSNHQPPLPSPGFPPHSQGPPSARPREYKSAEEAVQSLSGGREDLLPRIVHYGGHQPPTPPSPMPNKNASSAYPSNANLHRSGSSRRRDRDEYERDMGTPPLGRQQVRPGPFGEGRDTPETQRKKKDEFIQLCARAWDLFHS
ncbi:hypothetical protein P154DRAFT_532567 [Amniculicola lignicola CBS 123094]|uniref:Uncharacterized protein n=1 Tax=Amniculicola lignicola CBS 123094 TaxID=1392246 RepID=A0A6A5WNG8_9PLEO|nr:hypothetical protein P154DRAFT_532567 [Amniculicola lignicola CBS 123094]